MSRSGPRWHAVQTKPNQERKAEFNLRRQGYCVYMPKYSRTRRHARKSEKVTRPLFAGYLFVAVDADRQGWRAINSTLGVSRVVSAAGAPIVVPDAIITSLQKREGPDKCIKLAPQRFLKNGDKVRVTDGVFESSLGLFEGMKDSERALVLVDFLGRKVRAIIDPEALAVGI